MKNCGNVVSIRCTFGFRNYQSKNNTKPRQTTEILQRCLKHRIINHEIKKTHMSTYTSKLFNYYS